MVTNKVSGTLSPESYEHVMQSVADIKTSLDFLVDLTLEERRRLSKMGDKSRAFVDRAYDLATQNPDFLPRSFDLEEMQRDVELFRAMHPLMITFKQLYEQLDDTYRAVGADSFSAALAVYNYAKISDAGLAMDEVLKDMGRRFSRRTRPDEEDELFDGDGEMVNKPVEEMVL